MARALNLVLRIKQDSETQTRLSILKQSFSDEIQPRFDIALRKSKIIHFARVIVIEDLYLLIIAEYDGNQKEYSEFFRRELTEVFSVFFSLSEDAPSFDDLEDPDTFFRHATAGQIRSLGNSMEGNTTISDESEGYMFSAYGARTVTEILSTIAD